MPEDKIGVIGISTLDGPIGPNGNHLRWSFPGEVGFPRKGFRIFRRLGGAKPKDGIHFSQLPVNVDLPEDLRIDGVGLTPHPSGRKLRCLAVGPNRVLIITPTLRAQLEVEFPEPIVYAKVGITGSGSSIVRAYQEKQLLTTVSVDTQAGEISCAGITRLTIDLGARQLNSIGYITEADACNDTNWTLIKTLPLPTDVQEALSRFESGLKNYYAASPAAASQRYQQATSEIVFWLKRLLSPTIDFFEDPAAPPNLLKIRSAVEESTSSAAYLQSVFLLAAFDPNVARLMSLYWVDVFEPPRQQTIEPPRKDRIYDYKVEGDWVDSDKRCGLLLNLGQPPAPVPAIDPEVKGKQLGGLRWVNGQPLGRLGLKWPKPPIGSSPQTRAVQPVLYELTRFFKGKGERIPEPILVDNQSWGKSAPDLYVDRDLPLAEYVYEVRPLDLFGQLGAAIKSPPIKLEDLEAPPPPIRTRADISQTGATATLRLQFEFGASQHQQAPDVKVFLPYWRPDTLLTRSLVRVVVTSKPDGFGRFLHTLTVKRSDQTPIPVSELRTFVGDVLTNVLTGAEQPLAAAQRRRYRIDRVDDAGKVILEPTPIEMTSGVYELVQNPHNRHNWIRLQQQTVSWREPLIGTLREIHESLPVTVLSKLTISPSADPFASIPPKQRGRQFPTPPPPAEVVEVEINRLLTEPDVFAGGIALTSSNHPFDVIYVVSNVVAGTTRLGLPAGADVSIGDTLTLSPPGELAGKVRRLRISGTVNGARLLVPAGEIAFEDGVDPESDTVVMRAISNAVNATGTFDLIVRGDDAAAIGTLRTNVTKVRYYAPYVLSLPLSLGTGSAPIALPLSASEGYRDGFISVSATDVRNNEGPLGTPAQFSVIRPPPSGAPSKPYPCGMDITAAAGYATPPDRAGRATVCLAWDTATLDPADGARFEVARALDNSILAAHLRAWQMGKIQGPLTSPVIERQTVAGNLGDITLQAASGLIRATFEPATSVEDPTIFRNGRLRVEFDVMPEGTVVVHMVEYFLVTLAKSAGTSLDLLLRGPVEPLPTSGTATLEAAPDYSEAKNNIATLQHLALEAQDAFAMVTGVPIEANRFTDDVAGKGRNCFFYRVRAVDAAENRSNWSPISAPFYLADTSPPENIQLEQPLLGNRTVTLVWTRPNDPGIDEYRIFRSEGPDPQVQSSDSPYAVIQSEDTGALPLLCAAGSVALPNVEFRLNSVEISDEDLARQIADSIVVELNGSDPSGSNLFDPASGAGVFRRGIAAGNEFKVFVTSLSGLATVPSGASLVVTIGPTVTTGDPSILTWTDSGLVGGQRYTYRLVPVKRVLMAGTGPQPFLQTIAGAFSPPITVVGLDRSSPTAPEVIAADWVDNQGNPATVPVEGVRVRLRIDVATATSLLIQRRTGDDQPWASPSIDGRRGWQTVTEGNGERQLFDVAVTPDRSWAYRAQIRTIDGRTSDFSNPILVNPM